MSEAPTGRESPGEGFLQRHRWIAFVAPLAVFLLVTSLEPKPPAPDQPPAWPAIPYGWYPVVYALKIALTLGAMALVLPVYRQFPLRVTVWGPVVGVVGVVIWVGLCLAALEHTLLGPLGLEWLVDSGARSAYDPFVELRDWPALYAWLYLAVRLAGLALVVPVIEEFFLRGFLMRLAVDAQWWEVPFGKLSVAAVVVGTLYPILTHPGEMLAAVVWFSLVTALMAKTRCIWDCVLAHAVTNLLLGVYVVATGHWRLI